MLLQQPTRSWHFHIVGDGPQAASLKQKTTRLGINSHVDFHGHCPSAAPLISKMNAVVICSDHEGLPMVALEALALGVPVVAHGIGGLQGLLPPQNLVTDHTAAGYAGSLRRLFEDRQTCERPIAVSLPDQFTAASNAKSVATLYATLLTTPSHSWKRSDP